MRRFGLIGYPLSHSFSKQYFSEKFQRNNIGDCSYENFPIPEISDLPPLLEREDIEGLNVTIPYKQEVIPYLHSSSEVVQAIGACNCIKRVNGRLAGHNTDVTGFEQSLKKYLLPADKQALILGTGGSSKAVAYVLDRLGIDYKTVSRDMGEGSDDRLTYDQVSPDILQSHSLIVNTTPLGMFPKTEESPAINFDHISNKHYLFDLIYNPSKTLFLRKGEEKGARVHNGYDMLVIQAEESWKIWNSAS